MEELTFIESLAADVAPRNLSVQQKSLWYFKKGDWQTAHDLIDHLQDPISCHVHAFLHRMEGDQPNARYWYNRAGKPFYQADIEQEWQELAKEYVFNAL